MSSEFTRHLSLIKLSRLLWALVLVTLPVTSFRYLPFMGAGTTVRPLALYPLALLLPVLLVRLKRGEIQRPWPGALTVLLAFVLAALATSAFGATLAPVELRGIDFFDRALRAGITLVIGLSFFVAAVWMNQSEQDVKFSVKWLLVGLGGASGLGRNPIYWVEYWSPPAVVKNPAVVFGARIGQKQTYFWICL
jgi:hypothetical protein